MKKFLTTASLLVTVYMTQAQADLQNTGILYISNSSSTLYINGGLTNITGAALTNNGSLYVRQNLTNGQAAMAIGTGTLYLTGSSAQAINGTQVFKTFNLVSNNSSGITLNNDLSISGAHTFTAGIITSSATPNYLIYEAGSSYTGDADGAHVNGWVRKAGTTDFTFPVGNGTVERTIGLTNLSASSSFNVNYAGVTTNPSNVASPLIYADPNEYWIINQVSGGNAQVAMNWNNSKIAFPHYILSAIRVANYITGNWTSVGGSASGNVATTGTISSSAISAFGSFTFGSTDFLLPVRLLSFDVTRKNDYNLVSWTTTNEVNVKNYDIQRSDNGSDFYSAGMVTARNIAQAQQYTFTDNIPMKDVAYFRLRSVDNDGKSSLSKVVAVYNRTVANSYFAINNPVHDAITLTAGSDHAGVYNYSISAVNGQLLQQGRLNLANGGKYNIPLLAAIVKGVYVFTIGSGGFNYSQKIVVQ